MTHPPNRLSAADPVRSRTAVLALALFGSGAVVAAPIEFTDDFSADSLQLTIDRRDDGRSTRRYDVLGDRVTMANTGSAEERGRTELGTRGPSDFISARVSLSSESELPEGGRAAGIELSAWLYNTVQDEGAGSVENDGYAQFRIRTDGVQAGASICLFRARADDSLEGAGLFDGRTCGNFDGFEPELDTEYTLSITVERGRHRKLRGRRTDDRGIARAVGVHTLPESPVREGRARGGVGSGGRKCPRDLDGKRLTGLRDGSAAHRTLSTHLRR